MLLQKYWALVTEHFDQSEQVGLFWKKHMKGKIWGFNPDLSTRREFSRAWQNHKMQPSRGFFSAQHTRNRDSIHELADGFSALYRCCGHRAEGMIAQIAKDLFESETARSVREAHAGAVENLLKNIEKSGNAPIQMVAAMTAIFWFCFSIRSTNKRMWQEWKLNPQHDIPCPENRYNEILAYLYLDAPKHRFFPEDSWVVPLSMGRPDEINTVTTIEKGQDRISFSYIEGKGFVGVPPEWKGLQDLQAECPEVFEKHYNDRKKHVEYNSEIVGILRSKYVNCVPPQIRCECYEIDYLTHRMLEDVVRDMEQNRPALLEKLAIDISQFEKPEFGWLRSSVGTNTIIELPRDQMIVLHIRGETAEYGNAGKIYPSVVETIDLVEKHSDFAVEGIDPVTACVTRGLEEELGLPDCLRSANAVPVYDWRRIKHVAFARTLDFHQDNFFSIVALNSDIGINDVKQMAEHARERKKEIHKIITIPSNPMDVIEFMIKNDDCLINQTRYALWLYVLSSKK